MFSSVFRSSDVMEEGDCDNDVEQTHLLVEGHDGPDSNFSSRAGR